MRYAYLKIKQLSPRRLNSFDRLIRSELIVHVGP